MRHPATVVWQLTTSVAQAGLSWWCFLYLIPRAIVRWQQGEELHHLGIEALPLAGMIVLGVASVVNLWSRLTIAWRGAGLTLLFTPPNNLVVTGPYAWLRNPVIATMMGQGLGVLLYNGSALMVPYFGLLALLWHIFLRPVEEHELQRRFGREYEFYRRAVRLWLPMRRPFQPRKTLPPIQPDEARMPSGRRLRSRQR